MTQPADNRTATHDMNEHDQSPMSSATAGQSSWGISARPAPGDPPFTGKDRLLSTTHPHVMYAVSAGTVVLFAALGAVLMTRSVIAGVITVIAGFAAAAASFAPAHWSERHPDRAGRYIAAQTKTRNQLARRHPTYFLVFLPLVAAVVGTTRWNRGHHATLLGWIVPAVIALAIGLALGAFIVHRARHATPQRS